MTIYLEVKAMRFVSIREFRINPGRVQETLAAGHEVVLTRKGKPFAIITGITEETLEESLALIRQARAQAAVARMRKQAVEKGLHRMTPREIEALIAEVRRERE